MTIGIDGRLIEETGVGRYIRNLITSLAEIDSENHYVVFLRKKSFDAFVPPNNRWEKRLSDVSWHSITEQFVMPWLLIKEHLDLVHVPYFTIPIFYPGRLIVTIHDLTILHFNTGRATTLPLPLYKLRRLGYYIVLAVGLIRASHIIAVSESTKKEIIDHFHIPLAKITVTHEGIDDNIKYQISNIKKSSKSFISVPYFLYVGNAYPHKNLETLIKAFQEFISEISQDLALRSKARSYENKNISLVLVGKEDYFFRRLKKLVADSNLSDRVIFFGQANDQELVSLYRHAVALVFPSLMEGFGLPALEALSLGCPVICSDIPVFHETLGNHAIYFHPTDAASLHKILEEVIEKKPVVSDINSLLKRFSWQGMAGQTLDIYKKLYN